MSNLQQLKSQPLQVTSSLKMNKTETQYRTGTSMSEIKVDTSIIEVDYRYVC